GIYPTPVLGIVGILDDVTKAVPAHFQKAGDAILLLWPMPRAKSPDPNLKVPITPPHISEFPLPALQSEPIVQEESDATDAEVNTETAVFGSSEFARVVLSGYWGTPPPLDLAAEARLHKLLTELAWRKLVSSARDIADGGIATALAQAAFAHGFGATVEQHPSLMAHPLFGFFAEPASTVLVTAADGNADEVEKLVDAFGFQAARIGSTGGNRLQVTVDREPFVSATVADLRQPWAEALESILHGEVTA
ncbi:MAG: AIR synthase-related protein, partial [Terriglobales bacterium]